MLGRAATMINWPGWKPPVMSSRSISPDATPVTACRRNRPVSTIRSIACVDHVLELERFAPDLILGDAEDLALGRFEKLLAP